MRERFAFGFFLISMFYTLGYSISSLLNLNNLLGWINIPESIHMTILLIIMTAGVLYTPLKLYYRKKKIDVLEFDEFVMRGRKK